jgi:hypothetical protein
VQGCPKLRSQRAVQDGQCRFLWLGARRVRKPSQQAVRACIAHALVTGLLNPDILNDSRRGRNKQVCYFRSPLQVGVRQRVDKRVHAWEAQHARARSDSRSVQGQGCVGVQRLGHRRQQPESEVGPGVILVRQERICASAQMSTQDP